MIKKTKCILVADDDVVIRRFVAAIFRTSEFHVLEAGDGVEALRQVDAFGASINVLLVDVVMPRLNGAELTRIILSCCPAIKIILMSGHSDDVLDRHGIPASKLRCLKKPFTPDDLEQAVRYELKR